MQVASLIIRNFKGIERISFNPGRGLNVIAGPNAVGKTTILEAIRLAKCALAQRFDGEIQHALGSLGIVLNPAFSVDSYLATLANNVNLPVEIEMFITLDTEEVLHIRNSLTQLALMNLQTQLARSLNGSPIDLTQYLSTTDGQNKFEESKKYFEGIIKNLSEPARLRLFLTIDVNSSQIRGDDAVAQTLLAFLERSLSPNLTHFNYFTADRMLPAGEVQIQLGAADVQQQVQSYMATPVAKYSRVKQLIVQTLLLDENGRQVLTDEFNLIFDNLLPGKRLAGVQFNQHGIMRVLIEDRNANKTFDIDNMSSGEKGLVLTFLTLRLSTKNNCVVLLDEPELHLNAAVCSRITHFMREHCVKNKGLQVIVCSHSPEIVRDTYEDGESKLFHLRSSCDLSPVLLQDSGEVFEIMNRLGTSTADVLFSRGTVFVEGEHDAAIVQAGYPGLLQGFKVQPLGGRSEVEKEVSRLQESERFGKLEKRQVFIFDRDRKSSGLRSTVAVRVHQLNRYCIENYLLNEQVLFDSIKSYATKFEDTRGTFPQILETVALSQLDYVTISDVYKGLEPENTGMRPREIRNVTFSAAANKLWARIESVRSSISTIDRDRWISEFVDACHTKRAELEILWKNDWRSLANGKQIIDDLYARYEITMKKIEFKKSIICKLAELQTDDWRVLDSLLSKELS